MQEITDQGMKDFLDECEIVKSSIAKRKEIHEKNLLPCILGLISISIFIILASPLNPKSLVISAFNFYSDSMKIESWTNFFNGFSVNGSNWFTLFMGVFVANQFMAFPIMLPFMVSIPRFVLADLFILDHKKSEEIKNQIRSKSNDKSRKNGIYLPIFILLLPVLAFTITARANFSEGALYFVMGFFVIFYFFVIIIIAILAYAFLVGINDLFFRKNYLDEYVICSLTDCMKNVIDEAKWRSIENRKRIKSKLEAIADIFQEDIPRKADIQDPITQKNFRLIASRFRSLNRWIFTPKKDTRSILRMELFDIFKKYLAFDLDGLIPEIEVDIGRRKPIKVVSHASLTVFRLSIPMLLIFLFLKTPLAPEGPLRDYLVIGVFALTGLRVILEIDPSFRETLDTLLNFANKAKDTIK